MRNIGDRVFVVADNYGSPAVIIEIRESDARSLASHYKVRTDTGDEFWAFDFEVHNEIRFKSGHEGTHPKGS